MVKRVFLIVLDSFGIGEQPDAGEYGDSGSNTLGTVRKSKFFHVPNLERLGLFQIDGIDSMKKEKGKIIGSYGRMTEKSKGKDTTTGHWEIAGICSAKPMPVFPNGFPNEIIKEYEKRTGRKVLCNKPYSGTEVIKAYGREQEKTGGLIVYTSADSVFQVAAHEKVIPLEELYEDCRIARELMQGKYGVGRIIARPYTGTYPDYVRTGNRHDFSLKPPAETMLTCLKKKGFDVIGVGKIFDIFAGEGLTDTVAAKNNAEGMNAAVSILEREFSGLCFINLVDFDMVYGHRNDADGYAKAMTEFDQKLRIFIDGMKEEDVLMITADHGCDPGTESTDHSREYTPFLVYGGRIKMGHNLHTRKTFGDIGATILEMFDVREKIEGESFYQEIILRK